jgi:hypothetical protein
MYAICVRVDLGGDCFRQVLLEQLLDLGHVRAAVDSPRDLAVDHEDERRKLLDHEVADQPGMLVGVDTPYVQAFALLPGDVREQALHPAGGAGGRARKEDQHGRRRIAHYPFLLRWTPARN